MAIIVHFSPSGLDKSKYDDAIRRLEQAGAGSPPGRLYHCSYDSGSGGAVPLRSGRAPAEWSGSVAAAGSARTRPSDRALRSDAASTFLAGSR